MKDYNTYTAIDLVLDERFEKWARHPGMYPELDQFWRAWTMQYPDKLEEVMEAKRLIGAIHGEGESLQLRKEEDEVWNRLDHSLNTKPKAKLPFVSKKWMAASVAVLTIAVLSLVVFFRESGQTTQDDQDLISVINNGVTPKTVMFLDGSSVVLQPNSSLQYPRVFSESAREVTLNGEGFFEIAKEPTRPFYVYADKVVARVLGTSFIVRAFKNEPDILVQVKTGKVSVQTVKEMKSKKAHPNSTVVLIPNQQVIYSREESTLSKSLIENPALINSAVKRKFLFEDAPVKEVFESLEEAYGVTIVYDEEIMKNCVLNVSLADMPLYEKMRLICKTLEAKYEIMDSQIVVTGPGCE
ncbi:FecR family protein [Chryseolinea lacunae]|uniref:FecR family protein n=1 Tax=Chryseolinea lacunae TaxID=2801331 RepID=A0ABS1KV17_9BACT|nr:FecR family protein [Chryseolinea lacunae]MBL0743038.1 FecR family protein [Chryseolinea lacunae]